MLRHLEPCREGRRKALPRKILDTLATVSVSYFTSSPNEIDSQHIQLIE